METPHRRRKDREASSHSPSGPDISALAMIARQPSHDEIARLAYDRYQERGGRDGQDWEDWFQAERELRQRYAPQHSVETLIASGAAIAL